MAPRFQLVPAAYVYLLRPGVGAEEVLLQRRQNTGYMDGRWAAAVAGHVEAGESVYRTAVREGAEEMGIAVAEADLEPLTALHRTDGTTEPIEQRIDLMFACRRWSGTPAVVEANKAADAAWFGLDALPASMPPHERWVLERLASGELRGVETFGFAPEQTSPERYPR